MLVKRNMDEMITHFNDVVSAMDISIKDKMTILGMITAIGYEYQKAEDAIEEMTRIVHEYQKFDGFLAAHGMFEQEPMVPLPEPPKEET